MLTRPKYKRLTSKSNLSIFSINANSNVTKIFQILTMIFVYINAKKVQIKLNFSYLIKLFLDLDKFYEFKRSLKIQDKLFYGLNSGTEKEFK
jgi:hypothetical protein